MEIRCVVGAPDGWEVVSDRRCCIFAWKRRPPNGGELFVEPHHCRACVADLRWYRYYQEIERGESNPTLQTLFTVAQFLGVTVAALVDVDHAATERARQRLSRKASPPPRGRKPRPSRIAKRRT